MCRSHGLLESSRNYFGPSFPLCMATFQHAHFIFNQIAKLRVYGKFFIFCLTQLLRKLIMRKLR